MRDHRPDWKITIYASQDQTGLTEDPLAEHKASKEKKSYQPYKLKRFWSNADLALSTVLELADRGQLRSSTNIVDILIWQFLTLIS